MKIMDLNHWFIEKNELDISLMRYYVKVKPLVYEDDLSYQLEVYYDSKRDLVLNFSSLEDGVAFTEDTINKCSSTKEIFDEYTKQFVDQKAPYVKVKKDNN